MKMQFAEVDEHTSAYASEFQDCLLQLAHKHESVPFADQLCMMGVVIGTILLDVPEENREYYHRLLLENVMDAKYCIEMAALH
jgi:hypothetical protein